MLPSSAEIHRRKRHGASCEVVGLTKLSELGGERARPGAARLGAGCWLSGRRALSATARLATASVATSVDTWQRLRRAALSSPHVCTQVMSKTTRSVEVGGSLCRGGRCCFTYILGNRTNTRPMETDRHMENESPNRTTHTTSTSQPSLPGAAPPCPILKPSTTTNQVQAPYVTQNDLLYGMHAARDLRP